MDALTRLQGIYFFEHLTPEELAALAAICKLQRYVGGDDILKQGEMTTQFFIVDEGYVNLRHTDRGGFEKPVGSKGPGEFFGIKMFTTQEASEYTFEAVSAASLWVFERKAWDELVETHPNLMEHMPELRAEYERLTRGLEWLAPGEVIDLSVRRHPWALLLMIRLPLAVGAIATLLYLISYWFGVTKTLPWVNLVYLGVMLFVVLWLVWNGINWLNDLYIVTNKRVVRINKVLFFSDSRQDLPVEKIQSMRVDRGGPISVLLNISDLRFTTAASDTRGLVFEQVANVARIQQIIDNERVHLAERKSASDRERLRRQIAGEIQHYVLKQPAVQEKPPTVASPSPSPTATKTKKPSVIRIPTLLRARPKRVAAAPVPLSKRLRALWQSLLGTEWRQGHTVTWRKHHIVLLRQILGGLLGLLILVLLLAFFTSSGVPFDLSGNGVFAVLGVLMLVALGVIAWEWEDWRRDLYYLSDTEIIDTESLPFGLNYREQKAELRNIQDVTAARQHFWNVLFDYGNVDSRVAGSANPFTFTHVAHPKIVADEITERIELLKLRGVESTNREQTRTIVDAIIAYHRLLMTERHQDAPPPTATAIAAAEPETPAPTPPSPPPTSFSDSEFPPEADLRA